jgi:hypothetical protein
MADCFATGLPLSNIAQEIICRKEEPFFDLIHME